MANQGNEFASNETRLASKLSELENTMKQLQLSLLDEKLKLNRRAHGDSEDLPENWAAMNRLHLPQCPLARVAQAPGKPVCPVHGHVVCKTDLNRHSPPYLNTKNSDVLENERYTKLINEADNFSRLDTMNERFRELYDSSMFSPTFYRPKNPPQVPSKESAIDSRVVRSNREPVSDSASNYSVNINKPSDSFENMPTNRDSSTSVTSKSEACSDTYHRNSNIISENGSSVDLFNPFDAIESVKHKFSDIENYVREASVKSKSQGNLSQGHLSGPGLLDDLLQLNLE